MNRIAKNIGIVLFSLTCALPLSAQTDKSLLEENTFLLPEALDGRSELKIFARLLKETQWDKALMESEDESFVHVNYPPEDPSVRDVETPWERPYAFTVFAEHDSVFASKGIKDAATLTTYLQEHYADNSVFDGMLYNDQYADERHVVNRFVAYHLLPQILRPEQLVFHYNELDFDTDSYIREGKAEPTIPVYDYYTTMGSERRLLKVYESKTSDGVRLNRLAVHDPETFMEQEVKQEGIQVSGDHMQKASNGNIYFLNKLLVYDDAFALDGLAQERMRFDFTSLSPELMNLGYRRLMTNDFQSLYLAPDYMENIKVLSGNLFYRPGFMSRWSDYQGDELVVNSKDQKNEGSDVVIKLPPVPVNGTYQLRLGLLGNTNRGIVQYYFGSEDNMAPVGIPIDERVKFDWTGDVSSSGYYAYGWENSFVASDLILYQGGLMKGPNSFKHELGNNNPVREAIYCGRRIIGNFDMRADETYYFRIKMMPEMCGEICLDYLELVPRSVYDNPSKAEDIW